MTNWGRPTGLLMALAFVLTGCAGTPTVSVAPEITRETSNRMQPVQVAARRLARRHGADKVWVAFDLDNTLLAMDTDLGANQWYDWQSSVSLSHPCHRDLVNDRLAVQGALYHLGAMSPTTDRLPELIDSLASAGHPVLIVTARGHDFRLATFRELRRNRLNFRDISPGSLGGSPVPFMLGDGSREVLYEDGVLMLAGQHKGHMLTALVQYLQLPPPAAVVFADDKPENVDEMREGLAAAGIGGHLVHFTGEDGRVENFDPDATAAAWRRLQPALLTVESIMGTNNHDIPDTAKPECESR